MKTDTDTPTPAHTKGHYARLVMLRPVFIEEEGPFATEDDARNWSRRRFRQLDNEGVDTAYVRREFYSLASATGEGGGA